jgi:hypothetical protein
MPPALARLAVLAVLLTGHPERERRRGRTPSGGATVRVERRQQIDFELAAASFPSPPHITRSSRYT